MAEASGAQVPPTFKLVLVGDGGTGKVRSIWLFTPCLRQLYDLEPPKTYELGLKDFGISSSP